MSTFTHPALVANPRGSTSPLEVKFLVDTGAMFTCLPTPQLEAL
ncbi:MAG: Retroviral aspartyl protease, partial [Candidatus Rokubacteria bacterium]|nr:Retroviral aspartyl protease [Candidatus Rokubacteria bacterium]